MIRLPWKIRWSGSAAPLAPWRPYAAAIGRVGFVAWSVFAALAALGECFWPGFLANAVSPATLVVGAALLGGLSLLAPAPARAPRPVRRRALVAVGLAIAVFALAWYYFEPLADLRPRLAWAAAGIVGLSIWLLARPQEQ